MTQKTISGITVWKAHLPFRFAFSHNLATRHGADTLIVEATASDGATGYGQVLARDYLTGESLESAKRDMETLWWPALRETVFREDGDAESVLEALRPLYLRADAERRTASWAGVDVAVFAALRKPLPPFGPSGMDMPLVGVISASTPKKAGRMARVLRLIGYRRFKVKVGRDAEADAARLSAVRRAVGSDAWLAADANAAWNWDEAVRRIKALKGFGVVLVEEPLRREVAAAANFRLLEERTGVQVMADESVCTLADARALLERGSPSWWNLRLAKNGGYSGVLELAGLARGNGVRVYGGILVGEAGALAAAGKNVLFASGAECGEYGFSRFFLRGDPFRGSPAGYRGVFRQTKKREGYVRLTPGGARKFGEPVFVGVVSENT